MQLQELNSGIIFTDDSCIGCNKCISGCVAVGANVVVKAPDADRYRVVVDPNKCILCGTCIESCVHRARSYRDDTDDFFDALLRGEKISLLVAPTLLTDYEKQYHNILGYLKHLGVQHIYNTAFGGDLMVWVYMNFIHSFGLAGVISQFCPVIVNYLEKYKPELLEYLMPVQSPVMCTAIYISDYLKITDTLVYISPCVATKHEIDDVNTYGKVKYNVTFERLMKRIEEVDISQYTANDEVGYGLGALISMSGGLSDNIKQYIGFNEVLIQTAGPVNIFPYFDHYYKEVSHGGELPFLVDALSCTNGCNFGTGTNCGVELRNEMTFSAHRMKEQAYRSGNVVRAGGAEERLKMLNQRFGEFELSSFVRQYDVTRKLKPVDLGEEQFDEIYNSMYKTTENYRHTDCGACGYPTCRAMAYAIGTNVNHKENCINYAKECIRLETDKTNALLAEISNMNEELKKSTQLKSNFLANMSHEIRTPMNAIIGMAEMALRGQLDSEERGYIQQIKASGRSLLAIINDILDFSKIESGKMELVEAEYKVMSIINDTVNIVMTRIAEKNITLVVDVDPTIPFSLYGDDIRIKQVLVNFANNAVKFTDEGCVGLSLRQERTETGVMLTVAIRDTGIGIKQEDLEKLFTSFQQVDSKRNRNVEGTGLGLAISREFVRLMDGRIDVESVYGEGSVFSFTIPQPIVDDRPSIVIRAPHPVRTASYIENPYILEGFLRSAGRLGLENTICHNVADLDEARQAGATFFFIDFPLWCSSTDDFARSYKDIQVIVILDPRKDIISAPYVRKLHQPAYCLNIAAAINREAADAFQHEMHAESFRFEAPDAQVLIVDDNAINLTVAKGLLSPLHMQIDCASGAREAIQLIEQQPYDIVFMDHMMPDIDGIEATHIIRAMEGDYFEDLPIIALTANAINNAKAMFLSEGMSDFVAKPIEMVDITAKLRRWLPAEKIRSLGGNGESPEQPAAPSFEIEGLDVEAGVALSGSEELYRAVLADYHAVIGKKADLIERFESERNIQPYTIEVHALKSASRLIGASGLADLAAQLEKCGHDGDIETIRIKTPALLAWYRSLETVLAPFARQESDVEKQAVDPAVLGEKLGELWDALDDFDLDGARALMTELAGFAYADADAETFEQLREAVDGMEYDDAQELAKGWRDTLDVDTAE